MYNKQIHKYDISLQLYFIMKKKKKKKDRSPFINRNRLKIIYS